MSYLLMAIAGMWMADGVALLAVPKGIIGILKTSLKASPSLLTWSGLAAVLGITLLFGSNGLAYQPLWILVGLGMIVKGAFLVWAPDPLKEVVLEWCLNREPIDYRFWGLGLCALSLLMLDALGWLGEA